MNLYDLFEPFPKEAIHWRVGSTNKNSVSDDKDLKGIALAYIDARDVMERLDWVCGIGNWQCRYPFAGCCEIGINVNADVMSFDDNKLVTPSDNWIWKANGAGVTDYEAEKGQYSDAFKRAAVMWGIGQYLYQLPNEWVPIKRAGKSFKLITKPSLPNWALPGAKGRMSKERTEKYVNQMKECLANADDHGVKQLTDELDNDQKMYVWRYFNSAERGTIKDFIK